MPDKPSDSDTGQKSGLSLSRIIRSTLAGAIGVQSNKNREEDFKNGSIWVYIVSGIIFTALFILTVTTVVKIALSAA
jgi:hypothetical protein|tara:strand:- start:18674 stop:18904 length:231 start_codon:yes stop_codon:yes gene_type:complete